MSSINITPKSKIKVEWTDLPENYTRENKALIKTHFAKQYGVEKSNITISFISARKDLEGNLIQISDATIDNVLDVNYQHNLFKVWLEREKINHPLEPLILLDDKITKQLSSEYEESNIKEYEVKWIKINNLLSYGKDNELNLEQYKGVTTVSSTPKNTGGKTTLLIDSWLFLLHGKTTKTSKNEEIFNQYSEDDKLSVKGLIVFNGNNIIIERVLTRKKKRNGDWDVTAKLTYKKLQPDGTEVDLEEEDSIQTTKEIKKMIGNEDIFTLSVLTTGDNLMDLIESKPTENGKLLNKLVGLTQIEEKEAIARAEYNNWKKTKLSNRYKVEDLVEENMNANTSLAIANENLAKDKEKISDITEGQLIILNEKRDSLLSSIRNIDASISSFDKSEIETKVKDVISDGKKLKSRIELSLTEIEKLKDYTYDEVAFLDLTNENHANEMSINTCDLKYEQNLSTIKSLENEKICPTCNQDLPNVDNTDKLKALKDDNEALLNKKNNAKLDIDRVNALLNQMRSDKVNYDNRNRLEIEVAKMESDRKDLLSQYKILTLELKAFETNQEAIEHNARTQLEINVTNTKISEVNYNINILQNNVNSLLIETDRLETNIKNNVELISKLNIEEEKDLLYNTYIKMVGRNGITKIVVRSIIPIINSELDRIMDESSDLKLELNINDKNEVELSVIDENGIIKSAKTGSGYERTIASLALRCVLTKVSQLPKGNFIVFDEIFGKVSPENYDKVKLFFDKISHLYENIFLIVHDERLEDWGDNSIQIVKKGNISRII